MKKLAMICGLLFSVITFANAQGGKRNMGTPEERAAKMTARLTEKLSLTADQQTKIKAVFLDQQAQMEKTRAEQTQDRSAMRGKMMEMMKESDSKINAVLTEEQKKSYEAYKEERKSEMKNRGDRGGRKIAE
ncbi:DUF5969 family protein [Pedobacter sp. AW31-3R]|uniref:DUF5969 family protein n=1 Tax=Pedobacter sp. AW31-3R TaxID=3445781 RepID=UPI003FA162E8